MVKVMNILEHMKTRLGMYVPLGRDGCPDESVWTVLLRELIESGIRAFRAGRASFLEIRNDVPYGAVMVRYDGVDIPAERIFSLCNGDLRQDEELTTARGWYGGLVLPLLNVLSERLDVEIIQNGHWYKLTCGRGRTGIVDECLPLFPQRTRETCVSFKPSDDYLRESDGDVLGDGLLKRMGKAIGVSNPALMVIVNGEELIYEQGTMGALRAVVERSGQDPLIAPRQACYGTAKISLAVVRRKVQGRKLSVRMSVDGRNVHEMGMHEVVMAGLGNWIASCPVLRQEYYECDCFIEGRLAGGNVWRDGLKYAWSESNVTFELDSVLGKVWRKDIERCWVEIFKEFVG